MNLIWHSFLQRALRFCQPSTYQNTKITINAQPKPLVLEIWNLEVTFLLWPRGSYKTAISKIHFLKLAECYGLYGKNSRERNQSVNVRLSTYSSSSLITPIRHLLDIGLPHRSPRLKLKLFSSNEILATFKMSSVYQVGHSSHPTLHRLISSVALL